jgi:hypothetical protein
VTAQALFPLGTKPNFACTQHGSLIVKFHIKVLRPFMEFGIARPSTLDSTMPFCICNGFAPFWPKRNCIDPRSPTSRTRKLEYVAGRRVGSIGDDGAAEVGIRVSNQLTWTVRCHSASAMASHLSGRNATVSIPGHQHHGRQPGKGCRPQWLGEAVCGLFLSWNKAQFRLYSARLADSLGINASETPRQRA